MVVACLFAVLAVHPLVKLMEVTHLDLIRSLLLNLLLRVLILRWSVRAHHIPVTLQDASPLPPVVLKEQHILGGDHVGVPSGMGA